MFSPFLKKPFDQAIRDGVIPAHLNTIAGTWGAVRLGYGSAHGLGPLLEFTANAVGLDRLRMSVPGETFDADHRQIASEAAEAFDQRDCHTGACGSERRRQPTGAGSDHQHIGFVNGVDVAGWFPHRASGGRHGGSNACGEGGWIRHPDSGSEYWG